MKPKMFEELLESVREGGAILRGGQQQRVRTNIAECQSARLVPVAEALDLMSLTSRAARVIRAAMCERTAPDASAGCARGDLARRVADVLPGAV